MKNAGIGTRLTVLRERCQMSKSELARQSGLDKTTIFRIEINEHHGTSVRVRAALAKAFGIPEPKCAAYLDGYLSLDDVVPDPDARSALHVAIEFGDRDRWSKSTTDAARRLPLRGLSPQEWADQLDDMEAAYQARPSIWDRLIDPKYDIVDRSGVDAPVKSEKSPPSQPKKKSRKRNKR